MGGAPDPASYRDVDAVLVSHLHYDHLDLPSLERLGLGARIVAPRGAGDMLRGRGFRNVTELATGEIWRLGTVEIAATHADHRPDRFFLGPSAQPVGYVVSGSQTLYFAGDTALFDGMSSLAPRLDVALLPVGGVLPKLGPGHLDPRSAAEALRLLRPRVATPIHWGSFRPAGVGFLNLAYVGRPPHDFAREAARLAPTVDVRVVQPGERIEVARP